MNRFIEKTTTSGLRNIGASFKGIFFGFILLLVSIYLLWTNEGRAVHVARALEDGSGSVIPIENSIIDSKNDGKLVHLSGLANPIDTIVDSEFNVKLNAIKLIRKVDIYQWVEESESRTREKIGGGTETTTEYFYVKKWVDEPIESNKFKINEGHENMIPYVYDDKVFVSGSVKLGAFELQPNILNKLHSSQNYPVSKLDSAFSKNTLLNAGLIYIGSKNINSPSVGDLRISYSALYPQDISIVAKQAKNSFEEWIDENDEEILLVKVGKFSADNMFKSALKANSFKTWLFRLLGLLLMFMGFRMILGPLIAIGKIIPILGSLVNAGVNIVCFAVALPISLTVISIAWIAYRPIIGASIIAIAALIYFLLKRKSNSGSNSSSNSNSKAKSNLRTVRIIAFKNELSGEPTSMFRLLLEKAGVKTFVAKERIYTSTYETSEIILIDANLILSGDLIDFLSPELSNCVLLNSYEHTTKKELLMEKEITEISLISRTTFKASEKFEKLN